MTIQASPALTRVVSPAPRQLWSELWRADRHALATQSPDWTDAMVARHYQDASRFYEFDNGRRLVLPMVRRRAAEASFPEAWGIGGLLGEDEPTGADVAAVMGDLSARRVARQTIRPNPLHATAWLAAADFTSLAIERTAHVLDLSGGADHIWSERFTSKGRQNVRKAMKSGLEIELDTTGRRIPVFHHLFEKSITRWAEAASEPVRLAQWRARRRDPIAKFKALADSLGEAFRLYVAWHDGRPAAAALVLRGRDAHYTRGAMDKAVAGPTNANHLLHWTAIQDACGDGAGYYHMGDTGTERSLARFKESFGARPMKYFEYRLERLPVTAADRLVRSTVKRLVGFQDSDEAGKRG